MPAGVIPASFSLKLTTASGTTLSLARYLRRRSSGGAIRTSREPPALFAARVAYLDRVDAVGGVPGDIAELLTRPFKLGG